MELIIGFIIGMILLWLGAESETLAEYSERRHVAWLADRSRRRKAPQARRACRYVQAGYVYSQRK